MVDLDKSQILNLLGAALPHIIAGVRQLLQNDPDVTDEELIRALRADSLRIVDEADAWLAAHPEAQAAEGFTSFGKDSDATDTDETPTEE